MFTTLHQFQKMIIRTILHYQIDIVPIVEYTVKLDDVWVVQIELDFYLVQERSLERLRFYYLFWYGFQSTNKICGNMPIIREMVLRKIDLTVFTRTNLVQQLKIPQRIPMVNHLRRLPLLIMLKLLRKLNRRNTRCHTSVTLGLDFFLKQLVWTRSSVIIEMTTLLHVF